MGDLIDIGGMVSSAMNLTGNFTTILLWTMLLVGIIIIGILGYYAKKNHYPPFVKYRYRVEWFAPRGSTEKGNHLVPTFEDRFAIIGEGDNQYLLTQKERLILPYEYLNHMLGDKLYLRGYNRIEVFPFKPRSLKMNDKDKEKIKAITFIEDEEFEEVLNDGPREIFLARLMKSQQKLGRDDFMTKIAPYSAWILIILFTFMLATAILEHTASMMQMQGTIAQANADIADKLDHMYSTAPASSTPSTTSNSAPPDRPY